MRTRRNKQTRINFFEYAEEQVTKLNDECRYGTAQAYKKSIASFKGFLSAYNIRYETITLNNLDDDLISRYNRYLSNRGVIRNSISFYNRALRAIYNKAVRQFRFPDRHPFMDVYTGVDKTHNRAVSEATITKLYNLDLSAPATRSLEFARDLFIFSYTMRGIAFVDMAYLRKSNVKNGYISYTRKKTGVRLDVKIEPQIKRIIDKYAKETEGSEFLLPILTKIKESSNNQNTLQQYTTYQAKLSEYNRKLKELSEYINKEKTVNQIRTAPLTSYVSRHTWATAARNTNTSLSVISEGLGHSSEHMTRIYLGSFNATLIDQANKKLIVRMMGDNKKNVSMRDTDKRLPDTRGKGFLGLLLRLKHK